MLYTLSGFDASSTPRGVYYASNRVVVSQPLQLPTTLYIIADGGNGTYRLLLQ